MGKKQQLTRSTITVNRVFNFDEYRNDTVEIRLRNSEQAQAADKAGIPVYEREIRSDRIVCSHLFIKVSFADLIDKIKDVAF